MKTERRHDLKQIWLAKFVNDALLRIQPYWRLIAGVAVFLATVVFGVGYVSSSNRADQQAGWTEYLEAIAGRNPDALSRVALNHAGSSVAPWAQHASAQAALIEASSAIYFDRAAAKKDFLLAVDGFNAVLGQTNETLLRKRAQFGLGQAYEGLNELEKAIDWYKVLAEASEDGELAAQDWSDSAIGKQANRRLKSLQDPQTKEFYNWFFAQEPPAPKWPASGDAPGLPFGQLPSEPNFTLPTFPQSNDLDIDFEIPLDDTAESSDTGIFDTLDTDAAETVELDSPETLELDAPETLELDAPETSDAGADETALDNDKAGSGANTDGAEDSNEN